MSFFSKTESPEAAASRRVLETEKEFRRGIASVLDLIAPSAMQIETTYIQVSGKYARTFFVLTYPRFLSSNWLSPLVNLDQPMDISMFIYPMESGEVMKKLKNKVGQLSATIAMNEDKGNVRDPMLETAYHD